LGRPDQPHHLTGIGVAVRAQLGEQQLPVHGHLERAARRLDELDLDVRPGGAQLGRQTGGPRLVVSGDAVLDGDTHLHSIAALDTPRHTPEFRRISHPLAVPAPPA
jgi:hypothetical protein